MFQEQAPGPILAGRLWRLLYAIATATPPRCDPPPRIGPPTPTH
jgi:hypothetical protein